MTTLFDMLPVEITDMIADKLLESYHQDHSVKLNNVLTQLMEVPNEFHSLDGNDWDDEAFDNHGYLISDILYQTHKFNGRFTQVQLWHSICYDINLKDYPDAAFGEWSLGEYFEKFDYFGGKFIASVVYGRFGYDGGFAPPYLL